MAREKTTIRFEIRADKIDQNGLAPIRLIYSIKGERKYFSTGISVRPENWGTKEQCVKYLDRKTAVKLLPGVKFVSLPTEKEIKLINQKLRDLEGEIADIETRFVLDNIQISSKEVIKTLLQVKKPKIKKETPDQHVLPFIEKYIEESKLMRKPGSIKVYKTLSLHLKSYVEKSREDATFDRMDILFFKGFQAYLLSRKLNNVSSYKNLSTLKTILNYARKDYGIIVNPGYRDFPILREDKKYEVLVLTQEEFDSILYLDLSDNRSLDQVRDVFVFSCATGLRISDLQDLRRNHIIDGSIKKTAVKTNQKLDIPLNFISATILDKYRNNIQPLPMISEQKLNQYIKKVGEMAGINSHIEKVRHIGATVVKTIKPKYKFITMHMGRKVFTTLSLEKGLSIEETMALTGHTNFASFRRYVDISNERKKQGMNKAWGAPAVISLDTNKK